MAAQWRGTHQRSKSGSVALHSTKQAACLIHLAPYSPTLVPPVSLGGTHVTPNAPLVVLTERMLGAPGAVAQAPDESGFQGYLQFLGARARSAGVSEATIQRVAQGLTYNPQVIALDRAQPGANPNAPPPAFAPYRAAHVDAAEMQFLARIVAGG